MAQYASRPKSWLAGLLWFPNIERMEKEEDIDGLLRVLEHPKAKVRWKVMRMLGEIWNIPDLVSLGHSDPDVRIQAAKDLGQLNNHRMVMPLIASMWDPHIGYSDIRYTWPVRISAIESLSEIGDPEAIEPILEALRHNSWGYPQKGNDPLYASLLTFGETILPHLFALLQDNEKYMRDLAIHVLGLSGDSRAIEPLANVLKHEDVYFLKRADVQALAKIGGNRVVSVLIEALQNKKDPSVQLDIVDQLCRIQHKDIAPALINTLQEAPSYARENMITNIVRFGTPETIMAVEDYQRRTQH